MDSKITRFKKCKRIFLKNKKIQDFFIELSTSEIFFYSIGLRFPNLQEKPNLINRKFDIEKYFIETEKDRQLNAPLVILPEVYYILIIFSVQKQTEKVSYRLNQI